METPVQIKSITPITEAVMRNVITVLRGEPGFGQQQTALAALSDNPEWQVVISDGNWFSEGYLGGLHDIIDQAITWASDNVPTLLEEYQQTLKRLFPLLDLPQFNVPKDLTNTSSKEERTRFYNHEYQNELLVGLSEFLIETYKSRGQRCILIIDRANSLSPTAQSVIRILARLTDGPCTFKFLLLDYDQTLFFDGATELQSGRYSEQEIATALNLNSNCTPEKSRRIYAASQGNLLRARAILECEEAGIPVVGYLDPVALFDLYLSTKSVVERRTLLLEFIRGRCKSDDPIAIRNYQTFDTNEADHEHLRLHGDCMADYFSGKAPLVTVHAQSIRDKFKRLEALAEPSEITQKYWPL